MDSESTPRSRRALLTAAAGAAGAIVASAALPLGVAAHDADDIQAGTDNPTAAQTTVTNSAADGTALAGHATGAVSVPGTGGFGVEGTSAGAAGVFAWSVEAPDSSWFSADVTSYTGVVRLGAGQSGRDRHGRLGRQRGHRRLRFRHLGRRRLRRGRGRGRREYGSGCDRRPGHGTDQRPVGPPGLRQGQPQPVGSHGDVVGDVLEGDRPRRRHDHEQGVRRPLDERVGPLGPRGRPDDEQDHRLPQHDPELVGGRVVVRPRLRPGRWHIRSRSTGPAAVRMRRP